MFDTPILFIIFNRPDTTRQVFDVIKKIKPTRLFIAADGPRATNNNTNCIKERENCVAAREIVKNIDWPCTVQRKYSDTNQGCKIGVSSAITWFFDIVEEGIILEDDCLPDPSFFMFCGELLKKYRNIRKVKMISGDNFQLSKTFSDASYHFSRYPHIWGWATWRRAWEEYSLAMDGYPDFKKNKGITTIFSDQKIQKYWLNVFDRLYAGKIDTWDGQWVYAIYKNDGISITPNVNLVSNIGFDKIATHTKDTGNVFSRIPLGNIVQLNHPQEIVVDSEMDAVYGLSLKKNIFARLTQRMKAVFY